MYKPDIMLIKAGTNETVSEPLFNWEQMKDFEADYNLFIDSVKKMIPHCVIILCSPLDMVISTPELSKERFDNLTLRRPRIWELRTRVSKIAEAAGLHFLDLTPSFTNKPEYMTVKDGVHPNLRGYEYLGRLVAEYLISQNIIKKDRPNIIVFMVDDMGWQDCAVSFWNKHTAANKLFHTPTMLALEKQGVKFTNAYATPVCTPSRVSLLTGMNAVRHKVTNWTSPYKDNNTDVADSVLGKASWNHNGLSPVSGINNTVHATPLPVLLQAAGYRTIHVGKAHYASMKTPGSDPLNLGYQVNIGGSATGHPQSYLGTANFGNTEINNSVHAVPDLSEYHGKDVFLTEALTEKAIQEMGVSMDKKQPFFLYLSHYAVHLPFDKDQRYFKKYKEKGLPDGEAAYASLVEGMDKSLGDIMNWLRKNKLEENTVLIFISDNGGFSLKPRAGKEFTHNYPLKAGKGSVYEGGIRVPMLVKWPCHVRAGRSAEQPVVVEDLFPTVLELAGVDNYQLVQEMDGKSMMPFLKEPDQLDTNRILIWHFPHKWYSGVGPDVNFKSGIRKGNWKLLYDMQKAKLELYELNSDISEAVDRSASNPDKKKELAELLGNYLRKHAASMPFIKETKMPVPYPDQLN